MREGKRKREHTCPDAYAALVVLTRLKERLPVSSGSNRQVVSPRRRFLHHLLFQGGCADVRVGHVDDGGHAWIRVVGRDRPGGRNGDFVPTQGDAWLPL